MDRMNNLVSIITPSYNSKKFIKETIHSVLSQTYKNWEMIIVDDNSNDNSVEFISNIISNEPRIKFVKLNQNCGAANARNKALELAQGKYIAFLDSDDLWYPEKLETQLNFMKQNNYAFTFSSYIPITEDEKKMYNVINVPKKLNYQNYCKNTIIGCLTVIIDKNKVGDFRMPDIKSSHDMALWLLIIKRGFSAYGLNKVLAEYRVVSTSNTSKKFKASKDVWKVYRKIEKLSLPTSIFYFFNYILNAILKRHKYKIKRAFDIFFSSLGLLFFGWIIIFAWFIASLETKSNGFFTQLRIGKNGEKFKVIKIKTMKQLDNYKTNITTSNDKRITFSGKFFRKFKIDELPQLINVLWGQMSFVGPRPDVEGYADKLEGSDKIILSLKSGITGPASLKYRNEESILAEKDDPEWYNDNIIWPNKVKINKHYAENWSFFKDIFYIIKTIIG